MQFTKFYSRSILKSINLSRTNRFSSQKNFLTNGEIDLSQIQQAIVPPLNEAPIDVISKLSTFSPDNIYTVLDVTSRDLLLYLANDIGIGLGWSIVAISLGIKLIFTPLMFSAQLNGLKMKLLEPESKNFQAGIQKLSQQKDIAASKNLQLQYKELRSKHNVSFIVPLLSMMQIPFLMTWFFSLRYVCTLPDKYPGLMNEGFLWFKNLSDYDPYGTLPILSATLTFMNISLNPGMAAGQSSPFGRYHRYLRFMPFASIPIVVFFPAGLNLYWCTAALAQLLVAFSVRSIKIRTYFGVPLYLPGTILERLNQNKTQNVIRSVIQQATDQQKKVFMQEPKMELSGSTTTGSKEQSSPLKVFTNKQRKNI